MARPGEAEGQSQQHPGPRPWWQSLGPGLITGASDDDPSGIVTYSQVGAQFGTRLLWLVLFSYPLMLAAQLISAQIGRVTGKGLAASLGEIAPRWVVIPLVALLLVANVINIGADLGAMGAAAQLLLSASPALYTVGLGLLCAVLQIVMPYSRYVHLLKWLTLSVLSYVAVVFALDVPWKQALEHLVLPQLPAAPAVATAIVAVLGTTITPYLFFWQASQEVEEQQADPKDQPLREAPQQASRQLAGVRTDTYLGMAVSNVIAFFVMLTAAVTLYAHGIHEVDSAADAAKALEPLAGRFATALFAAGIIGTGLLAIPVLAGSAGYAVGDIMHWRTGLQRRPAAAKRFYAVIGVATLAGAAMNFTGINPMKALYWSAVVNGVIAPPILLAMVIVARRARVMGTMRISAGLAAMGLLTAAVMAISAVFMALAT